ncbi:MAG: ABC transporter ATP-binding protein [Gammaproteobacteria bacterium]|nr:ABC transporter ATP-binding protein [Pseudomonadota bacterium]MCZ6733076.1 ABC transporter ATP-binding protein [Gammaproteobacteria bacterium]
MIRLQQVHRIFEVGDQKVHALNDVSLDIKCSEYIAMMGPSGSGKSTLLNILGLLDQPTSGEYILDGQDVTALSDQAQAEMRRDKIGFVFQFFHLVPRLSATENIALPMVLAGVPVAERKVRVSRILDAVGLTDRAHHRPDQLSGGQRQRVAIARATVMEPAVILADEPTGNLDSASGKDVLDILERLNDNDITLIVVTHNLDIAKRARRRLHMVDGRIDSDTTTGKRT